MLETTRLSTAFSTQPKQVTFASKILTPSVSGQCIAQPSLPSDVVMFGAATSQQATQAKPLTERQLRVLQAQLASAAAQKLMIQVSDHDRLQTVEQDVEYVLGKFKNNRAGLFTFLRNLGVDVVDGNKPENDWVNDVLKKLKVKGPMTVFASQVYATMHQTAQNWNESIIKELAEKDNQYRLRNLKDKPPELANLVRGNRMALLVPKGRVDRKGLNIQMFALFQALHGMNFYGLYPTVSTPPAPVQEPPKGFVGRMLSRIWGILKTILFFPIIIMKMYTHRPDEPKQPPSPIPGFIPAAAIRWQETRNFMNRNARNF